MKGGEKMKIGVIADDLTGANATGVRLRKNGFNPVTMVYYNQPIINGPYNAICVDTDSRYSKKEIAARRVETALQNLSEWGADVICKRIDSTVRGNLGIEIDTVLKNLGENSVAIVVASYPESGRITSGGYLLVEGVPVQTTDVAKDPVMPLTKSYIPHIIKEQSKYPISLVGLESVLNGRDSIEIAIREKIKQGNRIIVIDAVTDEEIETIAQAMVAIKEFQIIPVDPGPLTAEYAKAYSNQHINNKKIIVTVGSVTTITNRQLLYLMDKASVDAIYVNPKKLIESTEAWETEVEKSVQKALLSMDHQDIVIITTNNVLNQPFDLSQEALEKGMHQNQLAKRIADGLGKVTRLVIEKSKYEIQGCFSSGGDITASICSISMAEGIQLEDEVLPLVAYGKFVGGIFDGLPIITKGGMVGDKRAMHTCVKYLSSRNSTFKIHQYD